MPKTSNVKPDPRAELAKLQEWYDEQKAPLMESVAEIERIEAEKKLAEQEAARAAKQAEAAEIAKYLVETVSPKADALLSELIKVLIERRDLGRELATRYRDVASSVGNQFEYSAIHETACAELLALWSRRHNGRSDRHETYTDQDSRIVHRLYFKKRDAA